MTDVIKEASRQLTSSLSADISNYGDGDALGERISEWLDTPVGTLMDKPEWGNNLGHFKHDPLDENLAVAMELAIVEKITQDIKDLVFLGISIEILEIDYCKIIIRHQFGDTITEKKF